MKTIVVPLDGSEQAERALPLASAIALKQDADVVLVTAIEAGDRWVDDGFVRQWEAEEQAAVDAYLRPLIERLMEQGVRVRKRIEWGRARTVIENAAAQTNAHFIIMTTHGRSGASRWVLGSVADSVLRTTSTPLILVHPAEQARVTESVQKVVVALDGSQLAETALTEAEHFAKSLGASLLLLRAVVPPAALYGAELVPGSLPVLEQLETDARAYLDAIAERLRPRGLEVAVVVAVGPAAEALIETARENGADLIVMTSHGRSGLARWAFGSVADAVVRRSDLPVLVVRPPEAAIEEAQQGIPVAGMAVVPPPRMTEEEAAVPAEPRAPAVRPHRPERQPGR
jgi:nucleotide-binding universal stress UspA family protein